MIHDYAERARALVGTRFRAQGRSAAGLDCVGLVLAVYDIPDADLRQNYSVRGAHEQELSKQMERFFRAVPKRQARAGDVLLLRVAAEQMHLAVLTAGAFVHAHAGLRRVVETPGAVPWPVVRAYRRRARKLPR